VSKIASDGTSEGASALEAPAEAIKGVEGRTPWQLFWRRFRRDKVAIVGLFLIGFIIFAALSAGFFAKNVIHHPDVNLFHFEMLDEFGLPKGPNAQFWFGADPNSRDLFLQVLYGARTSLIVAFFATGIEIVIGVALGVIAGFFRGKVDTFISRTMDVVLSLPVLLLALGLVSACGLEPNGCLGGLIKPGLLLVSYVIGLFSWPYIARIVRGQVLSLREKEFVEAARSMGAGNIRIMFKEILPNIVAPIVVYTTLLIPSNILFEAALSYLGIGVPITTPSWGRQLSDASGIFDVAWWTMFFPGLFLLVTTVAFNLVGDGLRDALDPRGGPTAYGKKSKRERRKEKKEEGLARQEAPQGASTAVEAD
jgi:peptide/nickel transport system permease protein